MMAKMGLKSWPRGTGKRRALLPSLALVKGCFVSLSWSKMKSHLESQADVSPSVTQFEYRIDGPDSSLQNLPKEGLLMSMAHWGVRRRACTSLQATWKGLSGKLCQVVLPQPHLHQAACLDLFLGKDHTAREAVAAELPRGKPVLRRERGSCHQALVCVWDAGRMRKKIYHYLIGY